MVQGSLVIAEEEPNRVLFPNADTVDGENIAHLFPLYVPPGKFVDSLFGNAFDAAVCPSTANQINSDPTTPFTRDDGRTGPFVGGATPTYEPVPGRPGLQYAPLRDLYTQAGNGAADGSGGHSYEVMAWAEEGVYNTGNVTGGKSRDGAYYQPWDANDNPPAFAQMKTDLWVQQASEVAIIGENDKAGDFGIADVDANLQDNHAEVGSNFGYMDGHVAFAGSPEEQVEAWLNAMVDMSRQPGNALTEVGVTTATTPDGRPRFTY
jgi:prepilin-type processing-associated H-X9-DG protein